jgi:conjugal transfer/entry exclusion protein
MRRLVGLLMLLLGAELAQAAGIPVVDIPAAGQRVQAQLQQLKQLAESIRQTVNQIEQIRNQVQQIEYAYTTVQHGIQNLQQFHLNNATDLLGLYRQLDGKLSQASLLSYQYDLTKGQVQQLYGDLSGGMDGPSMRRLQRIWARNTRETSTVAVGIQALYREQESMMQKNRDLMTRVVATQGNLDTLQALGQGQGLQMTQLLAMERQMAVQGRVQAIQALEAASMQEATSVALDEASATVQGQAIATGRILSLSK